MANNNRVYYAVHAVGIARDPEDGSTVTDYKVASGVQSVGINTTFNLEQVYQLGQQAIYQNIETLPDVECTIEKLVDGSAPIQHLATPTASANTLSSRFNTNRANILVNYYDEDDTAATGDPSAGGTLYAQVLMSGMYVSALNWNFPVDGNFTESVTFVGNDKIWASGEWEEADPHDGTIIPGSGVFKFIPSLAGTDTPPNASGVQRRQHMEMSGCRWPAEIPGMDQTGANKGVNPGLTNPYGAHLQTVTVAVDLGRAELFELGRKGPYHRYVDFPVEITTTIEMIETEFGDLINARQDQDNVTNQQIYIKCEDSTTLDLGSSNKLASITSTGGEAGGGNRTTTYTYTNFNDYLCYHTADPVGFHDGGP